MEDLRESEVIASRFWRHLLDMGGASFSDLTYRHGLFLLFLCSGSLPSQLEKQIVSEIWKSDDAGGSNAHSDEMLRSHSLYSWLAHAGESSYPKRLERAYIAAVEIMDPVHSLPFGPDFAGISARRQFDYVDAWLRGHSGDILTQTFDYGLRELDREDYRRENFAANLAASCFGYRSNRIAEPFSRTAAFARELAKRGLRDFSCVIGDGYVDPHTVMRLYMQQTPFSKIHPAELLDLGRPTAQFYLIDPTPMNGGRTVTHPSGINQATLHSAVQLVNSLFDKPWQFDYLLAIVPQIDCTTKKWPLGVRRMLIDQGRLAAVIDLPKNASDNKRRFSAWLLIGDTCKGRYTDRVLFVDADPIVRLTPMNEASIASDFIGALVANVFTDAEAQIYLLNRLEASEPLLAGIFARDFSPDHVEAPGLSRYVGIDELVAHDFALTAKNYLKEKPKDVWDRGLDRESLNQVLFDNAIKGKRMYVIGNNGEGKSLLLRNIAHESTTNSRLTIAIAFGATDRFPKKVKGTNGAYYRYRGARTTSTGINSLHTAVEMGAKMLQIHGDPQRQSVLGEALRLVGFSPQLYLIPKDLTQESGTTARLISGIARLNSLDEDDLAMIKRFRDTPKLAKYYKLGLQRSKRRESIISFDELSSGEQQIIILLTKLIAEAASGALLLVDEPELSLHVSWQRTLPKLFQLLAKEFRADVLVATHSPIVISSADNKDDFCFTIQNRAILPLDRDDQRSVESSLFGGFKTYTNNNREVHERCASLVAHYIELANSEGEQKSADAVLKKLREMKNIISAQRGIVEMSSTELDMELVERAEAAVLELGSLVHAENSGSTAL